MGQHIKINDDDYGQIQHGTSNPRANQKGVHIEPSVHK